MDASTAAVFAAGMAAILFGVTTIAVRRSRARTLEREWRIFAVPPIDSKYDRIYRVADRKEGTLFEVNVARLECTCPDWKSRRSMLGGTDCRRVCEHLYDSRLQVVEKDWGPFHRLFIRYGRTMPSVRLVEDERGMLAIGQPFAPHYVRAIGIMDGEGILATYNTRKDDWSWREHTPDPDIANYVLPRMRRAFPELFRG